MCVHEKYSFAGSGGMRTTESSPVEPALSDPEPREGESKGAEEQSPGRKSGVGSGIDPRRSLCLSSTCAALSCYEHARSSKKWPPVRNQAAKRRKNAAHGASRG